MREQLAMGEIYSISRCSHDADATRSIVERENKLGMRIEAVGQRLSFLTIRGQLPSLLVYEHLILYVQILLKHVRCAVEGKSS